MENKKPKIHKPVKLDLSEINPNIFAVFGAFSKQARREGWSQDDIETVLGEAKRLDYDHAIATIYRYCEDRDFEQSR